MPLLATHALPRKALACAAIAGVAVLTGSAAVADNDPIAFVALGMAAAGVGAGVKGWRSALSPRVRYERYHRKLAGPRPGAKLG